jgi:hypothetical protein
MGTLLEDLGYVYNSYDPGMRHNDVERSTEAETSQRRLSCGDSEAFNSPHLYYGWQAISYVITSYTVSGSNGT